MNAQRPTPRSWRDTVPSMADVQPLSDAQLRCLAAWLPVLEAPDFHPGDWRGGDRDADGVMQMPWYEYDGLASWPGACGEEGLVAVFDWMAWLQTPAGAALAADPAAVASASRADLARLITSIRRGDRFSEGNIAGAFERGFLVAISRRAVALLAESGESI